MDYLARAMPQYQDTLIATASVLTLSATPVTLIAAPGAGLGIVFLGALFYMPYNSATYASGGAVNITWANTSGSTCGTVPASFVTSASTSYCQAGVSASPVIQVNQPLVVYNATGAFTTGNSPINIRVWYQIVQFSEINISG